jgi:hypothetical protein
MQLGKPLLKSNPFSSGSVALQAYDLQNTNPQRQAEFQQLTQGLQSDNLINAQQAFLVLTRAQRIPVGRADGGRRSTREGLQSGNPAGAQGTYSSIQ